MYHKFWLVREDLLDQEFDIVTLGLMMIVLVNQNRIAGLDIEKLKAEIKFSDIEMNDFIPIEYRETFLLILEVGTQLRSGDLPYLDAIRICSAVYSGEEEHIRSGLTCGLFLTKMATDLRQDSVSVCSSILKEYAQSGYPAIVRLFHTAMNQSRTMVSTRSNDLYSKLKELRNLTISYYKNGTITKEEALALANATKNFIDPLQRIHNPRRFVGCSPVTIDGLIAEFKKDTQQFRSRATFLAILDALIQTAIGIAAGAAIGFVIGGGLPGAAAGALVGGFAGISSLKFTMWHAQEYGFNHAMAEKTEAVIDAACRIVP